VTTECAAASNPVNTSGRPNDDAVDNHKDRKRAPQHDPETHQQERSAAFAVADAAVVKRM
jgi:hypothetical protein